MFNEKKEKFVDPRQLVGVRMHLARLDGSSRLVMVMAVDAAEDAIWTLDATADIPVCERLSVLMQEELLRRSSLGTINN